MKKALNALMGLMATVLLSLDASLILKRCRQRAYLIGAVTALLVLVTGTAHAQGEFDPRISKKLDTLLGESFDVAKNSLGLPDEQMRLIDGNVVYIWHSQSDFESCEIKLEVSSSLFGISSQIERYNVEGHNASCLRLISDFE